MKMKEELTTQAIMVATGLAGAIMIAVIADCSLGVCAYSLVTVPAVAVLAWLMAKAWLKDRENYIKRGLWN